MSCKRQLRPRNADFPLTVDFERACSEFLDFFQVLAIVGAEELGKREL